MCYDQLGPFIFFYMLKSIKLDNRIQYNLYTIINQCTWGTYQYMYEYIFLNTCLSTRIYMYARVSANYMKLCASWPFFIGFYFFLPKSKKKLFLVVLGDLYYIDLLLLRCQERRIKPSVELSQAKTLLQWFFVGRLVRDRLVVEQLRLLIHPSFIFLLITGKTQKVTFNFFTSQHYYDLLSCFHGH